MKRTAEVRTALAEALGRVLLAFVAAGGAVSPDIASDAIDAALAGDRRVRVARRRVLRALQRLRDADPDASRAAYLDAEEAVNLLVARATDIGFRVGSVVRASTPVHGPA